MASESQEKLNDEIGKLYTELQRHIGAQELLQSELDKTRDDLQKRRDLVIELREKLNTLRSMKR